jgi:hypothetical protein
MIPFGGGDEVKRKKSKKRRSKSNLMRMSLGPDP